MDIVHPDLGWALSPCPSTNPTQCTSLSSWMHVCGGWRGYAELRIEALFAFKAEGAL